MAEMPTFTVRPLSKQPRSDMKDSFRICLSPMSLSRLNLKPADLCVLGSSTNFPKTAIAWPASEKIQDTVVQTSKVLQELYGFKLGDKLSITKRNEPLGAVRYVRAVECTPDTKLSTLGPIPEIDQMHWEWALEYPLLKCDVISEGMIFEQELKGCRRCFRIENIAPEEPYRNSTIFQFTSTSKVRLGNDVEVPRAPVSLAVSPLGTGDMQSQIAKINERLRDLVPREPKISMPSFYRNSGGILIYGPKGTGKSLLLSQLGAAGWRKVFKVDSTVLRRSSGEGEAVLRNIFSEALQSQPSLIAIDQLDFVAPKQGTSERFSISPVLCESMDSVGTAHVLVTACARHPNDVDDSLRTPHRLGIEVELQVPTAKGRRDILFAIRGTSSEPADDLLDKLAERTHGYVGADLCALLQLACRKAQTRRLQNLDSTPEETRAITNGVEASESTAIQEINIDIQEEDISLALQETRPTAMREIFLETPKVQWTDIGGQHDIKRRLQKAVERPLKYPDRMKRLNISGKKGVLLYGPPGCSKTMMVKALASEAGLNFLAVKGAEILSMYVGESERALREIFRKARSASPSIVFFDEIDAIAARRDDPGSHKGTNVLTTLLNEMDGIEELKNVLVVAATNKPEILDSALMRPGRLDNILYIGPPDLQARKEILSIWFTKSEIDESVEVDKLAALTEGYSGAELVSICETAADAALDEEEQRGEEKAIGWGHVEYALGQVQRQISPAVIQSYETWRRNYT